MKTEWVTKTVESAWVWVPMPEKKYFGYARIQKTASGRYELWIDMVDPIPNKLSDECYGGSHRARTNSLKKAVDLFAESMLDDRERYVGDRRWKPSRETMKRLWKMRGDRLKYLREQIAQPDF